MVRNLADTEVRFLALSVSDEPEDVIAMIRAGAAAHVTKSMAPADLVVIRQVNEGDAVFSPGWPGSCSMPSPDPSPPPIPTSTS